MSDYDLERMFDALETAVDTLTIPLHRESIVGAIRVRDRLDAKVATALGEYQAAGLHEVDGSVTMASWLRHFAAMDGSTAIAAARRGAKLQQLPVLRAAFESGFLSGGAVDIVLANVVKRHLALFAMHEPSVVPSLIGLDIDGVTRVMREWRARADAFDPGPAPADKPDRVHLSPTLDGRGIVNGDLGSDLYNLLADALRVADPGDFDLPMDERRALALGQVCQTFLDFNPDAKHRRHRPHVTITVRSDDAVATYLGTGMPVSRYGLDVLRCDAAWHQLTFEGRAAILRYGRTMRDWPAGLYNAIAVRDAGCRWPGCTAPVHWCDVHHVHCWEDGGPTDVDNGVLLCRRHHRKLHSKAGWHLKLLPDGLVELVHPSGGVEISEPRGLDPPRLPLPPV